MVKTRGYFIVATQEQVQSVAAAVESGTIASATHAQLVDYCTWLAHRDARDHIAHSHFDQICEAVRLHLLRSYVEKLEQKNAGLQKLVVVLTVATLLTSGMQIWFAYKADQKAVLVSPSSASQPQIQKTQAPVPTPETAPSSGQPTKKTACA